MRKISISIFLLLFSTSTFSDVYVQPYQRSDGAQVPGHYRTEPNNTRNDNYSTQGNTNPHNGREGAHPRDNGFGKSGTSGLFNNR